MATPQNRAVKPAITYPETVSNSDSIEYTNTGFGQLPVPRRKTVTHSLLESSRSQNTLSLAALVLCLLGIICFIIRQIISHFNP